MILGTRWGWGSAPRPDRLYPPGKTRYPLYRRLGGPKAGLEGRKISSPPGFDTRTVQPVAQSLYRLGYPAHIDTLYMSKAAEGLWVTASRGECSLATPRARGGDKGFLLDTWLWRHGVRAQRVSHIKTDETGNMHATSEYVISSLIVKKEILVPVWQFFAVYQSRSGDSGHICIHTCVGFLNRICDHLWNVSVLRKYGGMPLRHFPVAP